jgi:L-threonylcarbamoyladenylate synthase
MIALRPMPDDVPGILMPARDPESLAAAASALASAGIVGLPTETVYGVGVLPRPDALEALVAAKRRPLDKGIPLLVDCLDQLGGLVIVGRVAQRLAERFWPGPLTLVLPVSDAGHLPMLLTGGRSSLAVRVPDHAVPRTLARELGPLAVSSANRSGEPEARTALELIEALGASLALVLDDGPVRGGVASSVVSVDRSGAVRVLREGALPASRIEEVVGKA